MRGWLHGDTPKTREDLSGSFVTGVVLPCARETRATSEFREAFPAEMYAETAEEAETIDVPDEDEDGGTSSAQPLPKDVEDALRREEEMLEHMALPGVPDDEE